jgi:predicted dehydrogenase
MKMNRKILSLLILFFSLGPIAADETSAQTAPDADRPVRIGVARLTHDHVRGILGRSDRGDVKLVGIFEPNRELADRYAKEYGFSMDIVFATMDAMLAKTKPDAVCAFGSIYEHLGVVEKCAPLGIHVMVEKPLAVSVEHALKMKALAEKYHIQLLTNYETTWYATHQRAYTMINEEKAIGDLRKIVVHDGHKGPKEIGCSPEFLEWLTDPVGNGGGAVIDFGCYGANLITWLKKGERPSAVLALTQQFKPDVYPKVDDEATILLEYPKTQGIIQASWNWPIGRKDLEMYGQTGYIMVDNRNDLRIRRNESGPEKKEKLADQKSPYDDAFSFLAAVVKGKITVPRYDLSSLENNLLVVEILEAAKASAKTGQKIYLKEGR